MIVYRVKTHSIYGSNTFGQRKNVPSLGLFQMKKLHWCTRLLTDRTIDRRFI